MLNTMSPVHFQAYKRYNTCPFCGGEVLADALVAGESGVLARQVKQCLNSACGANWTDEFRFFDVVDVCGGSGQADTAEAAGDPDPVPPRVSDIPWDPGTGLPC